MTDYRAEVGATEDTSQSTHMTVPVKAEPVRESLSLSWMDARS